MSNNKTLKVFSSTAVAGMIAAAMMSSQAFAAVDAYSVKVGDEVYKYDRVELEKSFLDSKAGDKAALYEDFTKKLGEAKGFYAFNDTKNGYVDYNSIEAKFLEAKNAGQKFDVNAFTESKDAKIVEVKSVKKAVVNKDGKIEYKEDNKQEGNGEISAVTAINAAQIKVEFKNIVKDEKIIDEIEKEGNYTIENKDEDEIKAQDDEKVISNAEMDASGKFAILTVNPKVIKSDDSDDDYYKNQSKFTLVIDEKVTGKEERKTFEVNDRTIPEVLSAKVVGKDTIKVKFNEPIKAKKDKQLTDAFEVNDDNISIDKVNLINNGTEANIILSSNLKDGDKVKLNIKSEAEDFAGYSLIKKEFNIDAKANKDKLSITGYKKAKEGEITLILNKDVKFADTDNLITTDKDILEKFSHTNSKTNPSKVEIDGNEVKLIFEEERDYLPNGSARIKIEADALEDLWDKKNDDLFITATVVADVEKPEIKRVKQGDNNKELKVKFSEEVTESTAQKTKNYTITDKDGKKVSIIEAKLNSDKDEVTLKLSKDLENGEKYFIKAEDVEDKAGNKIVEKKFEFKAKEKDAVDGNDIDVSLYENGGSKQKLVIDFDAKMKTGNDKNSITNLENYTLQLVSNEKVVKSINLSKYYNAKAKPICDDRKVEITIPGNKSDKEDQVCFGENGITASNLTNATIDSVKLVIGRVADVHNNVIDDLSYKAKEINISGKQIKLKDDKNPIAKDLETIEMIYDEEITAHKKDFHIITKTGKELGISKFDPEVKNGKTTIKFTLEKDDQLNFDGTYGENNEQVFVKVAPEKVGEKIKSENKYSKPITATEYVVNDTIAPELKLLSDKNNDIYDLREVGKKVKLDDRKDYDDSVILTKFQPCKIVNNEVQKNTGNATIVLTFEEAVKDITNNTFTLGDEDIKIKKAEVDHDDPTKVKIDVILDDETTPEQLLGLSIAKKAVFADGAKEYKGTGLDITKYKTETFNGNEVADFSCQVERISNTALNPEVAQETIINKIKNKSNIEVKGKEITVTVNKTDKVEDVLKSLGNVTLQEVKGALSEKDKQDIKKTLKVNSYDKIKDMQAEDIAKKFKDGLKLESGKTFKIAFTK